jgi:F420-dependent oxidoreductase-like protein
MSAGIGSAERSRVAYVAHMTRGDVIFGAFVPQGWKTELIGIDGAEAKWDKTVEIAVLAEQLGYDSVWVYDHFHNVPRPVNEAVFECWTTIAAISQRTSRVRLGQMVGCNSYRNPSLLAKITSTIDVISGGRLDWGIGAGWYDHEYKGYGFDFDAPKVRIGKMREAVEIVRSMWTQAHTIYEGRYYNLQGAQCDPKPLQDPHPPIWIGGGGEQLTLRVVARLADRANFGGKPDEWARKAEILKRHCKEVGRDYDEIVKTISGEIYVRETEDELQADWPGSLWTDSLDVHRESNLAGTPEQVCEKIQAYLDLGCTGFVPWNTDYPSDKTLRLVAEKVMPEFR